MMTTLHTGTDPRLLRQAAGDVAQLVDPIHIAQRQRSRTWLVTHPPLLVQLLLLCEPGSTIRGPERHTPPASRPAANLEALASYDDIVTEIAVWRRTTAQPALLEAPGTLHWCRAALRSLTGALPTIAPSLADALGRDIHHWWRQAAIHTGWQPADLERLR
jgi:hypothetical protein